jgi:NADPH2:quinone reductase
VVFDGVGGEIGAAAAGLLAPGGRFVAFGMASGAFVGAHERDGVSFVRGVPLTPERSRALSAAALAAAADGRLVATIGQTFALEDAAGAHAAIESRRTIGKTLLLA